MKAKKSIKYLFYTGLIFFVILLRAHIAELNLLYFDKKFSFNLFYLVIELLISIGLGFIFGLKHIIIEARKEGKWQFNFVKLIIIGTPLLFMSLYRIWIYGNIQFLRDILIYSLGQFPIFILSTSSVALFQLSFGYTVITSFYKDTR